MPTDKPPRWKRFLAPTLQVVVLAAVAWFLARTVQKEWGRIAENADKLAFDPFWLVAAGLLYLVGMLPCGLFWHRVLRSLGATPTLFETLRAYYIGHLGKYVPSKALVVVIRVALLRGRATTAVAALAVLYETLTMMAIGAIVGSLLLVVLYQGGAAMLGLGVVVASLAGTLVFPPVFRFFARRAGLKRVDPEALERLEGLDFADFIVSVIGIAIGWFFLGASVWAVIQALDPAVVRFPEDLLVCTAAAALSVVLGFVSLLPGGAGVREWVLIELLGPLLATGAAAPVVVAVMVRIVWTGAEVALAAALYPLGRFSSAAPEASAPAESRSEPPAESRALDA